MKPYERQVIEQLFARLEAACRLPVRRDEAAQRLIADFVARQPDAPYAMAQTILVQAEALRAAQAGLEAREAGAARATGEAAAVPMLCAAGASSEASVGETVSDGFLGGAVSVAMAVSGAIRFETPAS